MRISSKSARAVGLAVTCASLGAAASAIATAGAATTHRDHARPAHWYGARLGAARFGRGLGGAVHGQLVVPYNGGFATVAFDRGTIKSLSGQQLTLTEGTAKATYATPTLTIPSGAVVRNNGRSASLGQLTVGERVVVISGPKATRVVAHTVRSSSASTTTAG